MQTANPPSSGSWRPRTLTDSGEMDNRDLRAKAEEAVKGTEGASRAINKIVSGNK